MKKKIIVLLSLLVLLFAALSICVSAAESNTAEPTAEAPSLALKGGALLLGNSVDIQYIAEIKGVDYSEVKLLVWESHTDNYLKGTEKYAVSYINGDMVTAGGVTYPFFRFTKAGAKMMTQDYYTVLYTKTADGEEYYSAPAKYGILTYAYSKLGKTGTATTNQKLKDLINLMLDYGSGAQTYLGYETDRLANEAFYQVKTVNGTLYDGFKSGLYLAGEKITLKAPTLNSSKQVFSYWKNSAGESVSNDAEFELTVTAKHDTYTAVYEDCTHPGEWTVTLAPTCKTEGAKAIDCTVCGSHVTKSIPVDDNAHKYENKKCIYCEKDEVFVPTVPVDPETHNHTWGALADVKAASCTEDGLKRASCTGCTAAYELVIPAYGHDLGEIYSLGEAGHTRSCQRTGCSYTEPTEAHSGGAASCSAKAICTVCHAAYGDMLEHSFGDWYTVKSATCTEKGSVAHECTSCKKVETLETPIDSDSHNYSNGTCVDCGALKEDEGTAPGEGNYDTPLIPAG